MSTTNPQVVYFAEAGSEPADLLNELNLRGFACVLQGVNPDSKTRIGGSATASFAIVDLGEHSLGTAESIVKSSPQLSGRTVVVGPARSSSKGIVFTSREKIVETLESLNSK